MPGSALAYISYHPVVHVHLGPLSISPHGVGIAVGFLIGARLMEKLKLNTTAEIIRFALENDIVG